MRILKYLIFLIPSMFILFNSGCRKHNSEPPYVPNYPPDPGSVSGSISPEWGATLVTLDTLNGTKQYTAKLNTAGFYGFYGVNPGVYDLNVITTSLYYKPAPVRVQVKSFTNTEVPVINLTFINKTQAGTIDFTLDGKQYNISSNWTGLNYTGTEFTLSGVTPQTPSYYNLQIKLYNVNGAGMYNLVNGSSFLQLTYLSSPGVSGGHWNTNNGPDQASNVRGVVDITKLDPVTRTATGTFSATLYPQGATVGTKTIAGTFTNVLY